MSLPSLKPPSPPAWMTAVANCLSVPTCPLQSILHSVAKEIFIEHIFYDATPSYNSPRACYGSQGNAKIPTVASTERPSWTDCQHTHSSLVLSPRLSAPSLTAVLLLLSQTPFPILCQLIPASVSNPYSKANSSRKPSLISQTRSDSLIY